MVPYDRCGWQSRQSLTMPPVGNNIATSAIDGGSPDSRSPPSGRYKHADQRGSIVVPACRRPHAFATVYACLHRSLLRPRARMGGDHQLHLVTRTGTYSSSVPSLSSADVHVRIRPGCS